MPYGTVNEEATALEAAVADRYPDLSVEDRNRFAAAVLHKLAGMYRRGATVRLQAIGTDGQPEGWMALVLEDAS